MKSTFYTRIAVVVVAAVVAACSAATPDEKEERLKKLKEQQAALAEEISKLEEEIGTSNTDSAATDENIKTKAVGVQVLEARQFNHYVQTQAQVESDNNVLVSARSMGVVTNVYVNEGARVNKGQVLAQIDNSVILRSIESMKAQLELASSVYERQKNLWDQKIGTEVQYLQAKTNKESLEKQLATLQEQNEMTRITAPFAGVVDRVSVKVGENIAPGMPAVRVVNNDDLKLTAKISEAYVTRVKKGDRAVVDVVELGKQFETKVTFAGRTIDPLSRTFDVEVSLPSDPDLRPNMTATVRIIFQTEENAVVIPVGAIQNINDEKVIYIAEKDGKNLKARRKVVTVKGVYGGMASVEGVKPGDTLITVGFQSLNEGDFIKI